MITASRLALSASAALAAALLIVGCSASPGEQGPTSSATPDDSGNTATGDENDIEAAWLDEGRMFGLVTWGSSTCVPMIDEVSAEGQKVTVSLVDAPSDDGKEKACTSDFAPRASIGALPEGVDPTKDVELLVTFGDITDDVDLDGNPALAGVPGGATSYVPSAGWFDDEGIVLLTWGSSSCPPLVDNLEVQDAGATVTFKTEDGVCTMDMAPRATVLGINGDFDDEEEFTLTLVGANLDGTVSVLPR